MSFSPRAYSPVAGDGVAVGGSGFGADFRFGQVARKRIGLAEQVASFGVFLLFLVLLADRDQEFHSIVVGFSGLLVDQAFGVRKKLAHGKRLAARRGVGEEKRS